MDETATRGPARDVYALYVRTRRWKYVLYTQDIGKKNERHISLSRPLSAMPERRQGEEDLFDLEADPCEMNDLADEPRHQRQLATFRKRVLDWWRRTSYGSRDDHSAIR